MATFGWGIPSDVRYGERKPDSTPSPIMNRRSPTYPHKNAGGRQPPRDPAPVENRGAPALPPQEGREAPRGASVLPRGPPPRRSGNRTGLELRIGVPGEPHRQPLHQER